MATNYYVDPVSGDDENSGEEGFPKKTIQGAIDLITGTINDRTIIHLKNDIEHYTDEITIHGITCVGKDAILLIETEVFTDANYNGASGSPYNSNSGQGTFDIDADDKPVAIQAHVTITNSFGVVFRGVEFLGSQETAIVQVMLKSEVLFQYCRFEGMNAGILGAFDSFVRSENCCYSKNLVAIRGLAKTTVMLVGDNYFADQHYRCVVVAANSLFGAMPWMQHPFDYFTTHMTKSTPCLGRFAAFEAMLGSTIYVNASMSPEFGDMPMLTKVHVHNSYPVLDKNFHGIIAGGRSLVLGLDHMRFTTVDDKGDTVPMPETQKLRINPIDETEANG